MTSCAFNVEIVVNADRIFSQPEIARLGCFVRVEINDLNATISPVAGHVNTARNGWIVFSAISAAGIEHDKTEGGQALIPPAP